MKAPIQLTDFLHRVAFLYACTSATVYTIFGVNIVIVKVGGTITNRMIDYIRKRVSESVVTFPSKSE